MKTGNTAVRIIVSIIAIPLILLICYLGQYYFLALVCGIGLLAHYEYLGFGKAKGAYPYFILGSIVLTVFLLNFYFLKIDFSALLIIIVLLYALMELFHNKGSAIINLGAMLLGILYIGLFLGTLILIREFYPSYDYGGFMIIAILGSIWLCDSAAFFGGTALGKHKLFERVSPKKSWEGAIFGFIFAILGMLAAKALVPDMLRWRDATAIGFIIGTIGQLGDLIESLWKRDAGVKDSSALIPGHGGVFDRFDSLIAISPVVYLYLKYLQRLI